MKRHACSLFSVAIAIWSNSAMAAEINHDGEFNFLKAQHGEAWETEDQQIDEKLADLRKANGGKRPNILYVLIDDVSFGQMGRPGMNDVMGVRTPSINQFAPLGKYFSGKVSLNSS